MRKIPLIALLSSLVLTEPMVAMAATPTVTEQQKAALETVRREVRLRNFERAVALLKPLAQSGNAEAQYMLASFYRAGRGVQKDEQRAAHWLQKAADQGHDKASFTLARLYESGRGVEKDTAEAQRLIQQAASAGHTQALKQLDPDAVADEQRQTAQKLNLAAK